MHHYECMRIYMHVCMCACIKRKQKKTDQEVGCHVCFGPRIYTCMLGSSLYKITILSKLILSSSALVRSGRDTNLSFNIDFALPPSYRLDSFLWISMGLFGNESLCCSTGPGVCRAVGEGWGLTKNTHHYKQ